MPLRTDHDGIPRSSARERHHSDGPNQNQRCRRLAATPNSERRTSLSRFHRLLPIFRPQLLDDRPTPNRTHKESGTLPLGNTPKESVRDAQNTYVSTTNPTPTRLQETLLPCNRRFSLRRRSRTLTGGRVTPSHQKTNPTPHSLLLSYLHPDGKELRYL